jgi:hypothetical protein
MNERDDQRELLALARACLSGATLAHVESLLREEGLEPDVVKYVLFELNRSGGSLTASQAKLARTFALNYL